MVLPSNKKKVKLIGTRAQSEENNLAYSYLGGGGGRGMKKTKSARGRQKISWLETIVSNSRVKVDNFEQVA